MWLSKLCFFIIRACLVLITSTQGKSQPNIVFIVADDLGYNDVPWHNALVRAPTLQRLARKGVILEQSYVQPICTPSRSALMTGRYPYHLGRQHEVLWPETPTGLTLNYTLLPQRLRQAGYRTHMVGKWHLGYCKPEYTPTRRGFESFFGYWLGSEDYYSHIRGKLGKQWGLDFRQNMSVAPQFRGQYSAEIFADEAVSIIDNHKSFTGGSREGQEQPLFMYVAFQSVHAPLQVPSRYLKLYPGVRNKARRTYLGMVSALDDALSRIETALHRTGLYSNTIIIFTTDNGGQVMEGGNNFPLRGNKNTLWEGGTRGASFVHSPLLEKRRYVNRRLIHITDWYPTLLSLAGVPAATADVSLDGFDQWATISRNKQSPRNEMVYNIDIEDDWRTAIRVGDWKLVWGYPGSKSGWYPEPGLSTFFYSTPKELQSSRYRNTASLFDFIEHFWQDANSTWLFNLAADPSERQDLSVTQPHLVTELKNKILQRMRGLVPADVPADDPAGNPNNFGHVYQTGWC